MRPWQAGKDHPGAGRWEASARYAIDEAPGDRLTWVVEGRASTWCTVGPDGVEVRTRAWRSAEDDEPTLEVASWSHRAFLREAPRKVLEAAFGRDGREEILAEVRERAERAAPARGVADGPTRYEECFVPPAPLPATPPLAEPVEPTPAETPALPAEPPAAEPAAPAPSAAPSPTPPPALPPPDAEPAEAGPPPPWRRRATASLRDLVIAALVLAALAFLFQKRAHDTRLWWRARVMGSFVSTPAVITASGAEYYHRQVRNSWSSGYRTWIRFAWEADGQRRERVEDLEDLSAFNAEPELAEFKRRFAPGLEIPVQRDPADAAFAVYDLEDEIPSGVATVVGALFSLLLGIPGLFIAGWMLWRAVRRLVHPTAESDRS